MLGQDDLEKLIVAHQERLQILREQAAEFGPLYAPPYLLLDIKKTEAELQRLQLELKALRDVQPPNKTDFPPFPKELLQGKRYRPKPAETVKNFLSAGFWQTLGVIVAIMALIGMIYFFIVANRSDNVTDPTKPGQEANGPVELVEQNGITPSMTPVGPAAGSTAPEKPAPSPTLTPAGQPLTAEPALMITTSPTPTHTLTPHPITPTATATPSPVKTLTLTETPSSASSMATTTPGEPGATLTLSPTVSPTVTTDAPVSTGQFTLLKPISLDEPTYGLTEFEWVWTGSLAENQGFEVRVWRDGEPPAGVHNAVLDNQNGVVQALGNNRYRLIADIANTPGVQNKSGDYNWTVMLVQITPEYRDLSLVAEPPGRLRYQAPGSGSSGNDSNGGVGIQ